MKTFYICLAIFVSLAVSRFIPHPPNFTSVQALSFYLPAILGLKFIPVVFFAFVITDIFIGFHQTLFFTWGSIIIIGLISKYFTFSTSSRILGSLVGCGVFFIFTNFGVWLTGGYGYNINGFLTCYIVAVPFFGFSLISTMIFSFLIEISIFTKKNYLDKKFNLKKY